jgi:hypothetical protein
MQYSQKIPRFDLDTATLTVLSLALSIQNGGQQMIGCVWVTIWESFDCTMYKESQKPPSSGLMEAARASETVVNFYQTTWLYNPSSGLMEAARTSETLVNLYQTTWRYNPEDSNFSKIHFIKQYLTTVNECLLLGDSALNKHCKVCKTQEETSYLEKYYCRVLHY